MSGRRTPRDRAGCRLPVTPAAQGDDRDPATWPRETLAAIQSVIDRSRSSAGTAVLDTFDRPERRMSAAELVAFWNDTRMKAMATVSPSGRPHLAPCHAEFVRGRLRSTIYVDAVRRRDLRANPAVALTTWGPHGSAVILYGLAREVPRSERDTRPGASGRPRRTVALEIELTRVYAMKPRP